MKRDDLAAMKRGCGVVFVEVDPVFEEGGLVVCVEEGVHAGAGDVVDPAYVLE